MFAAVRTGWPRALDPGRRRRQGAARSRPSATSLPPLRRRVVRWRKLPGAACM